MQSIIVLTPLTVAIYLCLIARFIRVRDAVMTATLTYSWSWLTAAFLLWGACFGSCASRLITVYRFHAWSNLGGAEVGFSVWLDQISTIMCFTVLTVSICVQIFSLYYMLGDPHLLRFFVYLSLFTFCMLILVSAEDLLQLFVGWEAVGLCSYLLINFWYTRIQANKSAMKAILINRVGDFGLLFAICSIFVDYGTLNIYELSYLAAFRAPYLVSSVFTITNVEIICFGLFIATMSKSAQFGLHTWLPDAMEGPTPVSALIHAATMVTAGIYLMLRMAPLFVLAPRILIFVSIIGSLTMLFGATTALAQNDMKKVIAFSTCSQLGYMVAACGLAQFHVAFFHLVTHAFFKALLFLCAGVIIHAAAGEQDVRGLGGLRNVLPLVYVAMVIASFALMGIPFLSGFYSKELIIGVAWFDFSWHGFFVGVVAIVSAWCTSAYSVKLLLLIFWTLPRQDATTLLVTHVGFNIKWIFPLCVLSFFSITTGYFLKEVLVGVGVPSFPGPMASFINSPAVLLRVEWAPIWFKMLTLSAGFVGFVYSGTTLFLKESLFVVPNPKFLTFYRFFYYRWCLDLIYSWYFVTSYWRFLNWFMLLTVQRHTVDKLSLDLYIQSTESGSQLVVEYSGITPKSYLNYFMLSFVAFTAVYVLLVNPEAVFQSELTKLD